MSFWLTKITVAPERLYSGKLSAAVYDSDGVMVRTIYAAKDVSSWVYSNGFWDGTIDDGSVASSGDYTIRSLTHSASYSWEGVVGNTSDANTSGALHFYHSMDVMHDMCVSSGKMFYCTGYDETSSPSLQTSSSNIDYTTHVPVSGIGQSVSIYVSACCTNGTTVFWGAMDPVNPEDSFVYGTNVSDNSLVTFSSGAAHKAEWSNIEASCINILSDATEPRICSMAVQTSGSPAYLFVARTNEDITVINASTGAVVRTDTSFTSPVALAMTTDNKLWIGYGGTGAWIAEKYTVNGDGTLTIVSGSTISGFSEILALAVSPDNGTLLVVDGGTTQQVKAYNNSTYASRFTLGASGGYGSSPTVSNTKFMFNHTIASLGFFFSALSYICYMADGSFWLGDTGNFRNLHFSSGDSPSFVEHISYVPTCYMTSVDLNDPTRVFAWFLEFSVDYSKSLGGRNGSWALANNWFDPDLPTFDQYRALRDVATLSNDKTYTLARTASNVLKIYELSSSGLRLAVDNVETLCADTARLIASGDLHYWTPGLPISAKRRLLTGFSSDDPTYGDEETYITSDDFTGVVAAQTDDDVKWTPSNNGVCVIHNGSASNTGYHSAGFSASTGKLLWRAQPSTPANIYGFPVRYCINIPPVFPEDGYYPIADWGAELRGSDPVSIGSSIFINFKGEGWGGGQASVWWDYHDSGLLINRFGGEGPYWAKINDFAVEPVAGNVHNPHAIAYSSEKTYVYCGDEWWRGGVHRWLKSGADTLRIVHRRVTWDSGDYTAPASDDTDLMAGLPFDDVLSASEAGWTRTPTTDDTTNASTGPYWTVRTSCLVYDPRESPDIDIYFNTNGTASLKRVIPSVYATDWNFECLLNLYYFAYVPEAGPAYARIEMLDAADKVIFRFSGAYDYGGAEEQTLFLNGEALFSVAPPDWDEKTSSSQWLRASANTSSGKLMLSYSTYSVEVDPFDPLADIETPTTLSITLCNATSYMYGRGITIGKARIY